MAKTQVRVEVLSAGIAALMQSAELANEVTDAADRISNAAGPYFEALPAQVVGDRSMALVVASDYEGLEEEARDKVLTKAVTACRS